MPIEHIVSTFKPTEVVLTVSVSKAQEIYIGGEATASTVNTMALSVVTPSATPSRRASRSSM